MVCFKRARLRSDFEKMMLAHKERVIGSFKPVSGRREKVGEEHGTRTRKNSGKISDLGWSAIIYYRARDGTPTARKRQSESELFDD